VHGVRLFLLCDPEGAVLRQRDSERDEEEVDLLVEMLTESTAEEEVGLRHLPDEVTDGVETLIVVGDGIGFDEGVVQVGRDERFRHLTGDESGSVSRDVGRLLTSRRKSLTRPVRLWTSISATSLVGSTPRFSAAFVSWMTRFSPEIR
jgi:hypothetical protein